MYAEKIHLIDSPEGQLSTETVAMAADSIVATDSSLLEVAEGIQHILTRSLRFQPDSPLDSIDKSQTATCVGYAVIGSECLEQSGVKHDLAFLNGHATIFTRISDENGTEVHMVDMLSPKLNQEITDSFILFKDTDDDRGRSFGVLSTLRLQGDSSKYPWMASKPYSDRRIEPENNRRLIVTLFSPQEGRQVIAQYDKFKHSYDNEDIVTASSAILAMSGVFPDIDIRGDSPGMIQQLVKRHCTEGDYETAEKITHAFYDSFVGHDPRVFENRADCLRTIARISHQSKFAKWAIELYEQSLSHSTTPRKSVTGKLAASQQLLEQSY